MYFGGYRYETSMPAWAGDPECGLCRAHYYERWSSLAEVQEHAAEGCPYCASMAEGLAYLIPDLAVRFGEDAQFRLQNRREMKVYADPNGSLAAAGTRPKEDVELEYRWFMADDDVEGQQYEPAGDTSFEHSFIRARTWIRECLDKHPLCGKGEPTPLPTRVLDLGEEEEEDDDDDDDDDDSTDKEEGGEREEREEEKEGKKTAGKTGQRVVRVVRLVEPAPGQTGRYMCLSHSWGGEQVLTTTTANAEEHLTAGIPDDRLPATFRDACDIARRLGVRFLWIDSLCILQDSPADWEAEAGRMGSVYRNSWLTIFAAASSSPSSGIYRRGQAVRIAVDDEDEDEDEDEDNDDDDDDEVTSEAAAEAEAVKVLFPEAAELRRRLRLSLRFKIVHPKDLSSPRADPTKQRTSLPLLSRAWAYQERLLAPRVLHFGPQEVLWECAQLLDCDCGGAATTVADAAAPRHMSTCASRDTTGQLPPKISHYAALYLGGVVSAGNGGGAASKKKKKVAEPKRRSKLLARWEEMVEEYTHRSLTFPSDRLPAFSGVAAEMVAALGGSTRYLAGQWEETLPAALLYERADPNHAARLTVRDPRPAPSWSWASVDGPVRFLIPLAGPPAWAEPVVHAAVLEVRCVPAGRDERGRVRRAESYLALSAELVPVELCVSPDDPYLVPGKRCIPIRDAIARRETGPQPALNQLGRGSFMVRVATAAEETKATTGEEKEEGREGEEEGEEEQPPPPPMPWTPILWFVPDVQLCDEQGEWLWDGSDEICCAKIMVSAENAYWLVLRRLPADGGDDGGGGPNLYERIGVVQDTELALPSTGVKTSIKII
ncbi:hypothetical protein VTG60DRAFT_3566 [Thermothelomyces hinnuleus]